MGTPKSHAQRLKEDIWIMRLHNFCDSYRPAFVGALLVPHRFTRTL